jgi:DNA-binding LytR/AlgR family response regulator
MNIIIIEDEVQTAWDLRHSIEMLRPSFNVLAVLDGVESSLEWLSNNVQPDLIFSDIQLGDGMAFDIFNKIILGCPIIFCTAYDEYAILAFRNNGIDYLLKPVDEKGLERSLAKFDMLKKPAVNDYDFSMIHRVLKDIEQNTKNYKSSFLVSYRDKLIPVVNENICFFSIQNELLQLYTMDNKIYPLNYKLDYLETMVDPKLFYRANRQTLLAYSAIREVEHYYDRKLLIHLVTQTSGPIIVSKGRASDFIKWMEAR